MWSEQAESRRNFMPNYTAATDLPQHKLIALPLRPSSVQAGFYSGLDSWIQLKYKYMDSDLETNQEDGADWKACLYFRLDRHNWIRISQRQHKMEWQVNNEIN